MALICPRCRCSNFQDAKQCYRCAAVLDAQRGDLPASWSPPAQDSFQRGTASFSQDWGAASGRAPAQDRADAFLSQHAPQDARKTDARHLLLHPLTSSPLGLLAMITAGIFLLGALWSKVTPAKPRAASARHTPAAQAAPEAAASEERDLFKETPEERKRRRWRESKERLRPARASDAFRPSSR